MNSHIMLRYRASAMFAMCALVGSSLPAQAAGAPGRVVAPGAPWVVSTTTHLSTLTISPGAEVKAAQGHSLTMTVDGVGTAVAPGTYKGDVVLTPTRQLSIAGNGGTYDFRSAVLVSDDKRVADESVPAAVIGGQVTDRIASGIHIDSREENFNGVMVMGKSTYTLDGARIDLLGNGGNDFAGFGAAIATRDDAQLVVNHARIRTHGAVRTALWIGGKSTLWVNDSDIEVESGQLPADYQFSIMPGQMKEVPYGLGIEGNVRATNLMDEATVFYTNSHFRSNGWGVLSSDGSGPTRMFVKDCTVEATGSGYGAYANGDAHDFFSHTKLTVADAGIIIGGNGWATLTDGSEIHSAKTGVFMHQGTGGSLLTVERKSKIIAKDAAVQVKGRGGDVIVDDAVLEAGSGVLIQAMENDDPIMKAMGSVNGMPGGPGGSPPGGGPPGGGPPGGGPPGGGAPPGGGGPPPSAIYSPDVHALIRNTSLKGDVLHALTASADMTVTLQHATLQGAISTSRTRPASGKEPDRQTFRTVGMVANDLQPSPTSHTLKVDLDGASRWVVARTSYINELVIADGGRVEAPEGSRLVMALDGVETPVKAGVYAGHIVLRVAAAP